MPQSTLAKIKSSADARPSKAKGKRPDIQGLRAIAVIAVIFDHLVHWPSGGFVGVDVFFVISGFLITGLLLRELDLTETISFSSFYRRRIRRIMPAAVVVLAVTAALSFVLFNASRAQQTLEDAVWALFFSANWHFAVVGNDYFEASGPLSPLQHFWSLAVEEQFYFVWPWLMLLIFWLCGRKSKWDKAKTHKAIGVAMLVIVVLSFGWAVYESVASPTVAYFSTFTRTWELGVGALLAVFAAGFKRLPALLRPVLGWAGIAGIFWSIFTVTADMPFPAPWAAAPVLATALVIAAGTGGEQRIMWPLTNRVTGYVGDISYSLYLWHFPVIILAQVFFPEPTPVFYGAAIGAMFILSVASFHLVEEPIRRSEWLIPKTQRSGRSKPAWNLERYKYAAVAVLAIAAFSVSAAALLRTAPVGVPASAKAGAPLANSGAKETAPPVDRSPSGVLSTQISAALAAGDFPDFNPSVESLGIANWSKRPEIACMNVSEDNVDTCLTGPAHATKTAALLGDSYAVAWLPGIRAALEPLGYKVQALTMGQCPAAAVAVTKEGGEAFPACAEHQKWAIEKVRVMQPDLTILASAQASTMNRLVSDNTGMLAVAEVAAGLEKTVSQIVGSTARVAVLSSPAEGKSLQECVTRFAKPSDCVTRLTEDWWALRNAEQKAITALKMTYVDTSTWFCNSDGYCPGFVNNTPVRVDTGHLTVEYSQKLAPVLARALK